ncbi:zinc finger protein 595-like [Odontomachus brunneus]|uniref:zinc finger protein 595-like n=1 Tax=Odontomachus brunneus TaxID=486640 RepID=UPI0013F28374|nr:zinc finger protein 595-like [Odontomachus brunneus]
MSCHGQGRCHFCCKRHTLPIFGHDEAAHAFLRDSNFKFVILNTVCSPCIVKIENYFKKTGLRLPIEGVIARKVHASEDPNTEVTNRGVSSDNSAIVQEKTCVHDDSTIIGDAENHPGEASSAVLQHKAEVSEQDGDVGDDRARRRRRQLTCEFCCKEFNHAGDLNKHRRTHTGEQPYTCDKCSQRFSYASNLTRHRRVHSGERPFSCRICGRSFARKDKFSAHLTSEQCIVQL